MSGIFPEGAYYVNIKESRQMPGIMPLRGSGA
jgi:hypothetical protein